MISLFIFKILFLIVFSFWLFHILRRLSFWLYIWQLKEYRLDRFFDGIKENKKILFPRTSIFALILIFLLALSLSSEVFHDISVFICSLFYILLGLRALYFAFKREWLLPKFTQKMLLLFIFLEGLLIFFGGAVILQFFQLNFSPFFYFLSLFSLEIFFPFIFTIFAGIFQIPIFFIKKAIIRQAKQKRNKFKKLLVIGITGSYGKTSTKEFLFEILSQKYKVLKTPANQNSEIGVANTVIKELEKNHEIFICEMGAYKKGEIKAICDIVLPKIGILTGISCQHISLFGSLKNIINTKYELINFLPEDGIAIFNGANEECQKLAQRTTIKKYVYSSEEGDFDVFAKNIKETQDFVEFEVRTFKGNEKIRLNLFGKYNIENFLGALTCALQFGISLGTIREITPNIKPSETSIRKKIGKNKIIIIDDSYSQNPDGVFSAIDYLKNYEGKKILLMPCLIELGKAAPSIHKSIGRKIGKVFDLIIITMPFYFEEIKIGAMESGISENKILFLNEPKEILEKVEPYFHPENVILIEGRISEKIITSLLE